MHKANITIFFLSRIIAIGVVHTLRLLVLRASRIHHTPNIWIKPIAELRVVLHRYFR
tara:strand:+ start:326 stop:496 length:171 start_codon:yes stop_codon:yes gene_type:complete